MKGGITVIDVNSLRGIISKNGYSQAQVAEKIGITPKTFYVKMEKGVFTSGEIQVMIDLLNISDPASIFFAKQVS
jgi:DNA-binding XRE family transcriptional regulator